MHSNFLINAGGATAQDLEGLGELVRKKVLQSQGISLEWEIMRVGEFAPEADGGEATQDGKAGSENDQ